MKKSFTMRCMLIALFTVMSMVANAEVIEYSTDGFKYNLDTEAKTAELAKFHGSQKAVVIPENVTYKNVTYSVTSLGKRCFYERSITSITIPSSVTFLGSQCFSYCSSLESITVDKNNKVFDSRDNCNAIIETSTNTMSQGCKTTVIPSSVTSLRGECFRGCSSLTSIDIPSSVTSLGTFCFLECSSLTSVIIPSSVKSLGDDCFSRCYSLTSITIPSSVTSLGDECFSSCPSLESITVDKKNKVFDSRENCNAIIKTSTNEMIQGCKTTVIPSSVTSLGSGCFYGCYFLKSIDIPSSVTSLGDDCFAYCESLTSIDIPSSVTSLGVTCFQICTSLTSVTIPSSVTSLGSGCFSGCSSLTSIDIPSSVTSLGDYCFSSCSSLESITVDKNNKVYDSRENCNAIIETSTNRMIRGCKTTVIPSSVTSLGDVCFSDCSSLTSITIPSSVTSLGEYCFFWCESLTSIDIPSSVKSLGDYCFSGCFSLTSIDIPSSVTSLGDCCFELCSSLTSIDIPSSVTSLGDYCFSRCSSLKTVTCEIETPITPINGDLFLGTPIDQATLYVLEASLDAYRTTSPWSGFGTILPITSVGINYNTANKEVTIDAVYDLDGKRSNGTSRGLNIIRMSDGTTRKVMK